MERIGCEIGGRRDALRPDRSVELSPLQCSGRCLGDYRRVSAAKDSHRIQPIISFEDAELCRDDVDEDKVSVLQSYWNASLQAKVLLMLFSENKH